MKVELLPGHLQDAGGRQRPMSELSRTELCLGMDLLARVVHTSGDVEILRPDEPGFPLEEVQEFRRGIYRRTAPHLLDARQEEIERELDLDRTSHHFVAARQGAIAGTLRVKAWPFESSRLSPGLAETVEPFRDHAEISRFVVHPGAQGARVGEKLFWGCLRWLCARTDRKGILWICRPQVLPYFLRFGLEPRHVTAVRIPSRGDGEYHLVAVDFGAVLDAVLKVVRDHPEELVKRKPPCEAAPSASAG